MPRRGSLGYRATVPVLLFILAATWMSSAAAADVAQPREETVTVMLGAFLPAIRSTMKVDNERLGQGDRFSLGDDLGVDDNTAGGWLGVDWRIAPRHRLGFTYSRFTLHGERDIGRQLQIGDKVFPIGAHLSTRLRLEIVPITYSYSLMKSTEDELAFTVGVNWNRLSFRTEGSATIASLDGSREASASENLPLPVLGVRYDHHFSERWSAGALAGVFALKYVEDALHAQGSLVSVRVYGEYRFSRHFGAGAALDGFKVRVEADRDNWKGGFDYGYWGPQVFLTARF
jgi:opacity protein-like surface antigen